MISSENRFPSRIKPGTGLFGIMPGARTSRVGVSRGAGHQHMSVDISNATATAAVDPSRLRIAGAIKQAANTTGISFE